jgi:hypothetical protein
MLNSLRFGDLATRPPTTPSFALPTSADVVLRVQSRSLRGLTKQQEQWIPTVFAHEAWTTVPIPKSQRTKSCVRKPPRPPPSLV